MSPFLGVVRRFPSLCLILSAVMTAAVLIFPVLAPLEWISLVPAMAVLLMLSLASAHTGKRTRLRRLYGNGFLFFFCYQAIVYHWFIYLYPLEFTGMSRAAAAVVVVLACFGLALLHGGIYAFAFPMIALVLRSPLCRRFRPLRLPLVAAVWCIFEWLQTQTWIGVPWGRLALGQVRWLPVIQTASLLGSYLISFLLLLVNLLLAQALLVPAVTRRRVMAALLVFGVNFAAGSILFLVDEMKAEQRETVVAAAVQGNISSSVKWSTEALAETFDVYESLTREAAARGAELIVWPESTIPYIVPNYAWMVNYLEALSAENSAALLVGCFTNDTAGIRNSMLTFTSDTGLKSNVYSKRHLVPFGEYLPLAKLVEAICPPLSRLQMMEGGDLVPGEHAAVTEINGIEIGSLICFDSIYETLALDSVRNGAELLAISTNDSWFRDSAAIEQHNAQAVLRAVETRRSVIRSANTGISSIITPRGTILATLEPLVSGQISAEVECNDALTLYARVGNLFIWLCMAGMGAAVVSYLPSLCRRHGKKPKSLDDSSAV